MGLTLLAIAVLVAIFGSLGAVLTYYVLDQHEGLRETPFVRGIRFSLETAGRRLDEGLRLAWRGFWFFCAATLGLVVVLAILKWAFEELLR